MWEEKEDLTSILKVSGPHYTKEDYENHGSIGAIIHRDDKILMMDHIKLDRWTIPVGKIKPGEYKDDTLKEEMMEELGIDVIYYKEVISFDRPYVINDIPVKIGFCIFDVLDYVGEIKNLEPHKHKSIKFMTIDEIRNLERISTATKATLRYLKEIKK